jgi:hypothetical protein
VKKEKREIGKRVETKRRQTTESERKKKRETHTYREGEDSKDREKTETERKEKRETHRV